MREREVPIRICRGETPVVIMVVESGSRAKEAAAPSGSRQQGEAQETERTATQGEPTPSIAGANDDMSRQEQSPLSTPEDVGELGVSDRDREWCRPGEKIGAEGRASGNASPHCPRGAAPDAKDTDKAATPLATATVHRENNEVPPKEEADATEGLPHDRMSAVELKGRGGLSWGGAEETAASEQRTKARDQAKRLALEVARLRSSLRATTSELNTERSTRVRVEVGTIYRAMFDRQPVYVCSCPGVQAGYCLRFERGR